MRKLARLRNGLTSAMAGGALLLSLAGGFGCTLGVSTDDDGQDGSNDGQNPPPPGPGGDGVETVAIYKRGSLAPIYDIIDTEDRLRINPFNQALQDTDITTAGGGFVTVEEKLDEIQDQIEDERGAELAQPVIREANDRLRAGQIPHRGNPSDVDQVLDRNNVRKILVPLGGDFSTPGNEVAVVNRDTLDVEQVVVGVKPIKTVVHEDGIAIVCNQYSNYLSVIDVTEAQLLRRNDGTPVEIPTEYYCSDVLLVDTVPGGDQDDNLDLYVANEWRGALLRYRITLVHDIVNDQIIDVVLDNPKDPISEPDAYITGVGSNPIKLRLSDDQRHVYVANGRGGVYARVEVNSDTVLKALAIGAPTVDVIEIQNSLFVPTTMIDRGYLARVEATPPDAVAGEQIVTGLNGQSVRAHPGAQFDDTLAYNFDDIRSGLFQSNLALGGEEAYYTDDIAPVQERFAVQARQLSGATAVAVETNQARNLMFLANAGSDQVQILNVRAGQGFRVEDTQQVFDTDARPFAMVVDDENDELLVANWGGETLQIFDLVTQLPVEDPIDLGYANLNNADAVYPSSNVEIGEYLYYNADWSNDGRKACSSCHGPDNLISDGLPYANGATAPTVPHNVKANWNLLRTNNYFWNGSFSNGSYASLAFAAQTRTRCEQIVFATVEGPSTPPDQRVGNDANTARGYGAFDAGCQPDVELDADRLPANFNIDGGIADIIAQQKADAAVAIVANAQALGGAAANNIVSKEDVSRFSDYYSVYELRLPPNPLKQLYEAGELSSTDMQDIAAGEALFASVGCGNCHDPGNSRAPYTDGLQHGSGADYNQRFIEEYDGDPRVVFPQVFIDSLDGDNSIPSPEINIHLNPGDFFIPFCFNTIVGTCLKFEDPLAVTGLEAEETRRLNLINQFNLNDPERGHFPGQVLGAVRVNTPSLRGAWWSAGYLRHAFARTFREATLSPGHPALRPGEVGYAYSSALRGEEAFGAHGATQDMDEADMVALEKFIESIE